jgi:hypothetical protein
LQNTQQHNPHKNIEVPVLQERGTKSSPEKQRKLRKQTGDRMEIGEACISGDISEAHVAICCTKMDD